METYELDPDVTRWGLHLLDVCTLKNTGCCSIITQYDHDLSQVEYVREGFSENANVENDEVVARALQEEFSRIYSLEASGLPNVGEAHLQASVLAQDWLGPSERRYSSGHENDKKAGHNPGKKMKDADPSKSVILKADDHRKIGNDLVAELEIFNSCSCPWERLSNAEDCLRTLDITDESALDGEVGKRFDQMIPVPHVPKTNEKIPSVDEEISDHQRLLERLQLYDLVELKVLGDGNCQLQDQESKKDCDG